MANGARKMRRKLHLKKGDVVRVISGSGALAGQQGKILSILLKENRVIVEGINYVYKHLKRDRDRPKGGRIQKEAPIQLSNVMLVCPSCQQPARLRMERDAVTGLRRRVCKKCEKAV